MLGGAEGDEDVDDDDGHGLCLFGIGRIRFLRPPSRDHLSKALLIDDLDSWGESSLSVLVVL